MKLIKRDSIHFGHVEIDDDDIAVMVLQPGGGLEALREIFAGVAFLLQIGYEKFRDGRVIIDEEEFSGIPGQYFHWRRCL